ncbi:MAG: CNNM domain-containing protein, partial [Ramlibacter sp.]
MEVLLIALLTLLNGVFAMSEMGLASSRKARLTTMAEAGDKGAAAALRLMEQPTRFLSTVQVGITSIGVLNGIVGEAAFSESLALWMQSLGMGARPSGYVATGIVVTVITFITIIFGELVPKRIGQLYPETVSRWLAQPMSWLARAAGPFVKLLTVTTQGVLKLLPIDTSRVRGMTEEEIAHSLEEGVDAGVIEQHERQMVQNLFQLDERPLTSLMLPRSDIVWLEAALS